ncbi:MAG TPA: PAS domain S-box protein [Terriglobales bacterium]|nr:PAS domain S-box protein [Terriglobales bacterium]
MKFLSNPIFLRAGLVLFAAVFAFAMGLVMMRRMKKSLSQGIEPEHSSFSLDQLPLHTYHAVIQQLKQQKHELQSEQQAERRRAKTSENISSAILSNLSSGVLFFTSNGLVRQANPAAKNILGFASPLGMSAAELFRDSALRGRDQGTLADAVQSGLRERINFRRMESEYLTPAGEERILEVTLSAVQSPAGEVLGSACLINDQTELAQIRRQQELRGEMSAEMALELRNSLTTISGYAQQLAASRDHDLARQLAGDIAAEAAQLDHTIGGFLAAAKAKAAAGT